ncbi:MAG: magnesium transporter, partial [Nanoarchaeota archaeon]|nr:magnesium transporter [Nanoarchaeota archaeon]
VRDIIAKVPPHRKEKLYEKLDKELKKKVEFLLQFDQSKAAGLMSLNYVIVGKNTEPKKLYQKITRCIEENSLPPHVLVRDRENHIIGYIPTKHLILKRPKTLEKYIEKAPIVRHYEDHQKKKKKFKNEEHEIVVITDEHKHILGIVEYHDLLKQLEKDETERIYQFAGVQKEEDILDPPLKKFKSRAFWLILNLFTAFLAAGTIGLFEETISSLVLLAMYMPIIAGMGGNAATQTLAVVIRGIVMHNIDLKRKAKVVLNEVLAGIGNGVINGILVAIVATLWNNMPLLGLVVFLSMVANLIIAAFFGTIIPFILEKLKIDPAVAATVFVTTATDVFGFFIFLGLAQMILL